MRAHITGGAWPSPGITISRFENGTIAEDWTVSDNAALLQQLGPRRAIALAASWLTGRLTGSTGDDGPSRRPLGARGRPSGLPPPMIQTSKRLTFAASCLEQAIPSILGIRPGACARKPRWTLRAAGQIIEAMAIAPQRRRLEGLLQAAAASITRLRPEEAAAAVGHGATLIDIRSDLDRERDGIVPGSLHIPRTVLEWRLAADSAWRNPSAPDLDKHVIIMCDHGCSSVLAAATLVELGFAKASDVIGGYAAWRDAGLATAPAPRDRPGPGELAGMRRVDEEATPLER